MDAKSLGTKLFKECWNQGKFEVLNDILNPKHIFHLAEGDLEGIPAYRELLEGYYRALNPTFELKHVIGEGSYAAIHYTESGTFLNDWTTPENTFKATGKKYSTFGVELINVNDGKIVEAWPGHESLTHYTQIGLVEWKGV